MHIMPRERFARALVAFLTLPKKRRYYYDPSDGMIRAFMGHSKSKLPGGRAIPSGHTAWTFETVDQMMQNGIEILHNTTVANAASILEEGITERGREHVHWYQ